MKGGEVREWLMVCVVVVGLNLMNGNKCEAEAQVPCYFIFGDSLVDNGNNNDLATTAKADYSPYGIDFSDGPTGRFSNGKNLVDVIAELLGFDDYIPPYATVKDQDILGVNYDASAASGIRDQTPQLSVGGRICMNEHSYRNSALMQVVNILGVHNVSPPHHLEMVVYEGAIREKPSSKEEARQFIKGYSGGHAATVSSVLVMNLKTGFRKGEWDKVEIYFHDILDQVIDNLIEEGFVLSCWRVGHRTSFNTTLR